MSHSEYLCDSKEEKNNNMVLLIAFQLLERFQEFFLSWNFIVSICAVYALCSKSCIHNEFCILMGYLGIKLVSFCMSPKLVCVTCKL